MSTLVRRSLKLACTASGFALMLTAMAALACAQDRRTPEIDAGSASSAVALLIGGVMLLKDRLRAK
ncbi:MAG TPA: hypothetical protein VKU82_03770 [Planctomycetaceae bacterium]|nr:hypothetical protein [Planctomycetaceae bacterium]